MLDFGTAEFTSLMYPGINAPSDFDYLGEGLFELRGILSAEEMRTRRRNSKDHNNGGPCAIRDKRGLTTHQPRLFNRFMSSFRGYFALDHRDSVVEVVV